jgi:hypothetical protein
MTASPRRSRPRGLATLALVLVAAGAPPAGASVEQRNVTLKFKS